LPRTARPPEARFRRSGRTASRERAQRARAWTELMPWMWMNARETSSARRVAGRSTPGAHSRIRYPGGALVPPGSVLFRVQPDASWIPIRTF
jgi:hypothetical protein